LTPRYGKFDQENVYTKLYQNRPRFVKDMTKTFLVFFGSQCSMELGTSESVSGGQSLPPSRFGSMR